MELYKMFADLGGFPAVVAAIFLMFFIRSFDRMVSSNEDHAAAAQKLANTVSDFRAALLENFQRVREDIKESKEEIIDKINGRK